MAEDSKAQRALAKARDRAEEAELRARQAEEIAAVAQLAADEARAAADEARAKAERARKKRRRAKDKLARTREKLDRAERKIDKWKRRARSQAAQAEVLRALNHQLTVGYREGRSADAAALHFAAEAINAFAADAVALRSIHPESEYADYADHLTFRLRQNLIEARQFLDEQGEVARAADLADLLNGLPPDNTHR
ncbi:MAG: hypothetical protein R2714_15475 [Microthrixaceae bacterium]|nr:hypothetical protein [Microthrixaceae bacterium]MCO5322487.1 hypothetical protein [Microthrixaceae bacterium]